MIVTDLKILRKKSKEHTGIQPDLAILIQHLEQELIDCERNGIGLSAIQINIPLKVAIIRTEKLNLDLYNATIISASGSEIAIEGCLSLPNQWVNVERPTEITLKNGDGKLYELKGFEARVALHEIHHWDGILIIDIAVDK